MLCRGRPRRCFELTGRGSPQYDTRDERSSERGARPHGRPPRLDRRRPELLLYQIRALQIGADFARVVSGSSYLSGLSDIDLKKAGHGIELITRPYL
jgi:hypothetical protein